MRFLTLIVLGSAFESSGCLKPRLRPGQLQEQVASVFGTQRKFLVTVPQGPGPFPVLFAYHGYTNNAAEIAGEHHFDSLAKQKGFIAVYPEGMADGPYGGSWNLGPQGEATCSAPEYTACYDSCKAEGCGACAWHTCADDLAFSDQLIAQLGAMACIDTSRLYLYGESAGAMFVYRLLRERPGVFAAAAPEQGVPYAGTAAAQMPPILHLHDRQDAIVPMKGGRAADGWHYQSVQQTLQQACQGTTKASFETSLPKVDCTQYLGCVGGPVLQCLYDGEHGDLPDGQRLKDGAEKAGLSDDFIWNFLQQFRNSGPEHLGVQWERFALAALLAAVILSGALLRLQREDKGEATALLTK